jgi:nucleoid DNA-binding protein
MPLLTIVSLKVWIEDIHGNISSKWYKVKNGDEVIDKDLCSGDKLLIDGIGNLEVLSLHYKSEETGKNPYRSLEITCGLMTYDIV